MSTSNFSPYLFLTAGVSNLELWATWEVTNMPLALNLLPSAAIALSVWLRTSPCRKRLHIHGNILLKNLSFHQKLLRDSGIQARDNTALLFLFLFFFHVVKCEGSYSRKKCFEMEVKSNFHYPLWHHGSPNTFCRELTNALAHFPCTEEGTLSWKQPDQDLFQMVPDDEITFSTCLLGRPNLGISNLGFICTTFV